MRRTRVGVLLCTALALAMLPSPAGAQTRFGVRAGVWDGPDPFVGLEALISMRNGWYFNPNVELVFGDHQDVVALSADFHYDLSSRSPYFWVGAGPVVLLRDSERPFDDGSETDIGLDLLVGIGGRSTGGVVPYGQAKVVISDDSRAALAVGLRF